MSKDTECPEGWRPASGHDTCRRIHRYVPVHNMLGDRPVYGMDTDDLQDARQYVDQEAALHGNQGTLYVFDREAREIIYAGDAREYWRGRVEALTDKIAVLQGQRADAEGEVARYDREAPNVG